MLWALIALTKTLLIKVSENIAWNYITTQYQNYTRPIPAKCIEPDIINILKTKNADVYVFDPHVKKGNNVKDLDELLNKSDYIILATDHAEFKAIDLNLLKKHKILVVIDGRNCLDKEKIKTMGILYHGIGRG